MIIFMGHDFDDRYAQLARDIMRRLPLLSRQTRRDPSNATARCTPEPAASASNSDESTPPEKATPSRCTR
jgi:hypothetical protein